MQISVPRLSYFIQSSVNSLLVSAYHGMSHMVSISLFTYIHTPSTYNKIKCQLGEKKTNNIQLFCIFEGFVYSLYGHNLG